MGLFKKIGQALKKTREAFAKKFESIFAKAIWELCFSYFLIITTCFDS